MAPQLLLPEYFLGEDQIAQARQCPVLTPAQLHLLRQQIDTLKRINVQLRALKYKARTGQELPSWAAPAAAAPAASRGGGGRGGGRGGRGRGGRGSSSLGYSGGAGPLVVNGGGRGRGRGRGSKRGREDESEDDDSIVARSSEEEEGADGGADGSSDEDGSGDEDGSDMESADSSESEEDFTIVPLASPRRTGRVRRVRSAAAGADLDSDGDGGSGKEEREEAGGQQAGAAPEPAGPEGDEEQEQGGGSGRTAAGEPQSQQGAGRMPKQPRSGKSGGASQGGSGAKRKGLFMVVSEDTASTSALHLPQLKPVRSAAAAADGEGSSSPANGIEEEDAVCGVCGDGDAVDDNVILLCEGKGCSVAVHQLCYGVAKVPQGKWLCDGCKAKLKPGASNCCVCPMVGGAVKKVTSLGRVVPADKASKTVYCHLACALWVPEIEVSDHSRMAGVRLDKLTAVRAKLRCELCKQAGGAAVQCSFGTCCRSFHVLCGRAAGQQLTFRAQDGEPLQFCELHSRPTFEKMVEEYVEGKRQLELHGGETAEEDS